MMMVQIELFYYNRLMRRSMMNKRMKWRFWINQRGPLASSLSLPASKKIPSSNVWGKAAKHLRTSLKQKVIVGWDYSEDLLYSKQSCFSLFGVQKWYVKKDFSNLQLTCAHKLDFSCQMAFKHIFEIKTTAYWINMDRLR